ncbi:MAG: hypothetical protein J0I12_17435 [Candidatus Eremiobacteraeota bacterium]|nr:hypothetical protein [Candidatus Eremiobacteraeota bacterium]
MIRQDHKLVYQVDYRGYGLFLGEKFRNFNPTAGDVDLNGVPDLIICQEQGTWRTETHIVELGARFRPILKFQSVFPPHFSRGRSGELLVTVRDSTFSGWRYCHADSPYPMVVLRLVDGTLKLAPDCMTGEPNLDLGPVEQPRVVAALTNSMTRALYTGHPALCLRALRASRLSPKQQADFLNDFKAKLRTSPWASQLADQI